MRKVFRVIVPSGLLLGASLVLAHGPVRQKVVEKIQIDTTPQVVWSAIKNYGDMAWLPGVESTDSTNLPQVDGKCEENSKNKKVWVGEGEDVTTATTPCAIRKITFDDGNTVEEVIKSYSNEKMQYAYKISNMSTVKSIQHSGKEVAITILPVSNYSASIMVKKNKKGGAEVIWKAGFYRGYMNNDPPPELTEEIAVGAVTGIFTKGLANLKSIAVGK